MKWLQDLIVRLAEVILRVQELERVNADWARSRRDNCNLAHIEGYEAAENQEALYIEDKNGHRVKRRDFRGRTNA